MFSKYHQPTALDLYSSFDYKLMPLSFYSEIEYKGVTFDEPKANVYFTEDEAYHIELAVPGCSREDFFVEFDVAYNVITVGLEREFEYPTGSESVTVTRKEWSYANFKRSFTLPDNVNLEQVSASYTVGILNIEIPLMANRTSNKRTIEIT